MDEFSILAALMARVEEIAEERDAVAVRSLHVTLGELAGVDSEHLAVAFRTVREGTICETAELRVEMVPVRWACRDCGAPIAAGASLTCVCGGCARLVSGDEVRLDGVELEG